MSQKYKADKTSFELFVNRKIRYLSLDKFFIMDGEALFMVTLTKSFEVGMVLFKSTPTPGSTRMIGR